MSNLDGLCQPDLLNPTLQTCQGRQKVCLKSLASQFGKMSISILRPQTGKTKGNQDIHSGRHTKKKVLKNLYSQMEVEYILKQQTKTRAFQLLKTCPLLTPPHLTKEKLGFSQSRRLRRNVNSWYRAPQRHGPGTQRPGSRPAPMLGEAC